MNKIGKIEYKKIQRVSPSQFYSMKRCPYKSVLAEAFNKVPLLPISPNAYLGVVLHKMLELIGKGQIKNELEFEINFDEQILIQENILIGQGHKSLVPLQKNVKDYGMKKVLIKRHLKNFLNSDSQIRQTNISSERWFESKDKFIGGRVDLIIEGNNYTEIVDFKTGAITNGILDDDGEIYTGIKVEYSDQLKLYAYLFFENSGRFPTHLSLIDLSRKKYYIEFTSAECKAIYEEAKERLIQTNQSISNNIFTANPSVENCKYCLYRPACDYFRSYLNQSRELNDIAGIVKKVVQYLNGNVTVFLFTNNSNISILGFSAEFYDYFNSNLDLNLSFYNIKKEIRENFYSTTKTTMIYE